MPTRRKSARPRQRKTVIAVLCGIGCVILGVAAFLLVGRAVPGTDVEYGATFSVPYAEELGLDPDAVLRDAIRDLRITRFRIPAYWSLLEPRDNWWNFGPLDRQIDTIEKAGGTVILAIGEKAPRWPECWTPEWWKNLPRAEQKEKTLLFLETIVTRYRDRPTVIAWQVENEPHFDYGDCPRPDLEFFKEEILAVRRADPSRPVVTTDSGELSLWVTFGKTVDALGISTYRVVRNPILGVIRYSFVPPYAYYRKFLLVRPFAPEHIYVSEFQMEPWSPLPETSIEEQFKTMDIGQMRKNLEYAERMRMSPVDFWGLEWWYWMKTQGHPEFWEEMKAFLQK